MNLKRFEGRFENEKVIVVKFTTPDFFLSERLRHAYIDRLIYSGFDETLLSASILDIEVAQLEVH